MVFILGLVVGVALGIAGTYSLSKKAAQTKVPITEGQWWGIAGIGAIRIVGFKYSKDQWGRNTNNIFWKYQADGGTETYCISPKDLWALGSPITNIKAWRIAQSQALSAVTEQHRAEAEIEALRSATQGNNRVAGHLKRKT